MKNIPRKQIVVTVLALVTWLMLYAAGLLLESIEHRIVLAPITMKKQLGDAGKDLYNKVMRVPPSEIADKDPASVAAAAKAAANTVAKAVADTAAKSVAENIAKTTDSVSKLAADTPSKPPEESAVKPSTDGVAKNASDVTHKASTLPPEPGPSVVWAFIAAFFCYSPTNMAMLTLTAGFLGGCVSNAVVTTMEDDDLKKIPERQRAFLYENPLSATMRGFVIYLWLVAGLYVAMDDPFKDSTPGQYARLAGSLSLVAFVVGYDPTRIEGWLRMAPGPQPSGK